MATTDPKKPVQVTQPEPKPGPLSAPPPPPLTLGDRLRRITDMEKSEADLELLAGFCADFFLEHLGKLDPMWKREIEAARIETRLDGWRLLGAWTARTLEHGNHINTPKHPLFEKGMPTLRETVCEFDGCGKVFSPGYSGQRFCSNDCGFKFTQLRKLERVPVQRNGI